MIPTPVAVNEQLPEPEVACSLLCTVCRRGLLYQRQERPRFPRHFFWCRQCGRRYAAWVMTMLGVHLGELFDFEALADACAADGRYEFLLTSAPLWVQGGVGSPPNAIAIR